MKSLFWCLLFSGALAFAQKPPDNLVFEVASIKPSEPMTGGRMMIGMRADAGMLRYTNVALKDCIRVAYRLKDFQVQGPDWIAQARFDITAKLPDGATQDQIPEMLAALLADRFKLTVHRETKDHAIYALVTGKGGPKLKPSENPTPDAPGGNGPMPGGEPAPVNAPLPPPPPGSGPVPGAGRAMVGNGPGGLPRGAMTIQIDPAGAHLKTPNATLPQLAEMISRFSERPILDMTEIKGQYDFDLVFAPETMRGVRMGMGGGPMPPPGEGGGAGHVPDTPAEKAGSIYDSVQRYGLKLEPRKAPMELLIVDHIEKTPTEN